MALTGKLADNTFGSRLYGTKKTITGETEIWRCHRVHMLIVVVYIRIFVPDNAHRELEWRALDAKSYVGTYDE
jgi:hypothetical protein